MSSDAIDDVRVRPATASDLGTLVGFVLQEAREAEGRALAPETVTGAVAAALDDPALARYWVLEDVATARPMGAIAALTEWSDWQNTAYWWIQFVFLAPEDRGKGYLARLLAAVRTAARAAGAPELRLLVHPKNARAIRAYEKLGFESSVYRVMRMPMT